MVDHVSPSQVNTFYRCNEQWYQRYEHGRKVPPGIAALAGSGMHKAAEANYTQKRVTGEDLPIDDIQDAAATGFMDRLRKDGAFFSREDLPSAKRLLGEAKDKSVRLARFSRETVMPTVQPVMVEERIKIAIEGLDVDVLGIIDISDANQLVIDSKTSSKSWNEARVAEEEQPTVYRELFRARTGHYPAGFRFDVFVNLKREPKLQQFHAERTEQDWKIWLHKVKRMRHAIRAGVVLPALPGSWWCSEKWCGYWGTCPHISDRRRRLPNV